MLQLGKRTGRVRTRVTADGLEKLAGYDWPGNLRELANVLERATILSADRELGPETLDLPSRDDPFGASSSPRTPGAPLVSLDEAQRAHIRRVLAATEGRVYGAGGAAEVLGVPPSTLQSRMKKLGLGRLPVAPTGRSR